MAITKDFLQQDLHKAIKELACISNCEFLLNMAILEEDYKKARIATENMARSFKELEQLRDKRRHFDGMQRLARDLGLEMKEWY